VDRVADF